MTDFIFISVSTLFISIGVLLVWLFGKLIGSFFGYLYRNNQQKNAIITKSKQYSYIVATLFIGIAIHDALNPSDNFYLQEFSEVTLLPAPSSATVVAKSASFPTPQGDYCSFSRIKLSADDYEKIHKKLSNDIRFSTGDGLGSYEKEIAQTQLPKLEIRKSFKRTVPDKDDHHLSIQFMDDGVHIDVHVCYT